MNSQRRATVAALVGLAGALVLIAGAGHVYLRRWRRAAVWFAGGVAGLVALTFAFVDPTVSSLTALPVTVTGPYFLFLTLSVADAYAVARGMAARGVPGPMEADEAAEGGVSCESCGRTTDPRLRFCWYCATTLPESAEGE